MKIFILVIISSVFFNACSNNSDNNEITQLELKDSAKLVHLKNQFYKNSKGQLFELTFADREVDGKLTPIKYFNGKIPQDIDPLSFEEIGGWYAKDKNHAYLYRPTSGGMLIAKLDSVDLNSFRLLKGHYNFAADKKHVFHEGQLLQWLDPNNLEIITDDKGFVTKLISGQTSYAPY